MTSSATKRSTSRTTALPALTLTTRDMQLLTTIADCTAMTAPQLSRLYFPPAFRKGIPTTHSNCLYRLKLLCRHGYLHRYSQPLIAGDHRNPYVYVLSAKGATLLATWLDCPETAYAAAVTQGKQLNGTVVTHLLLTHDVRVALMQAVAKTTTVQLTTWLNEHTLRQAHNMDAAIVQKATGNTEQPILVPDGYFVLQTTLPEVHTYHHFLEIDRGTEIGRSSGATTRDWAGKIQLYQAYYQSGAYQKRYGAQGLRVLTVTVSDTRLHLLKQLTEQAGGKSRYWFTTFDRIANTTDILTTPIWQVASKDDHCTLLW